MSTRSRRHSAACSSMLAGVAIVAVAGSLSACGGADGKTVAATTKRSAPVPKATSGNWNFEHGKFTGWHTRASGSGAWHVYSDGTKAPDPADTDPRVPFEVPAPPEGRFAAVTDMSSPGARILYRDVKLDAREKLSFTLFYVNPAGTFTAPQTLDFRNQQFRVDLMDPSAPADSLAAKHVLARIFRTAPGDPSKLDPRTISFDLSPWAGRKVRLRFAQVDNQGPMRTGVDDVRLEAAGS